MTDTERLPLTILSPDEILARILDEHDNILGQRLLAKGQSMTILGQGGLGKSRILLLLAAAQIIGEKFLELETHGPPLKWLIFQVENGMRRLQMDLACLREYCGEHWPKVNQHLRIHALETDRDGWLNLDEDSNQLAIAEAIQAHMPDVVCFDPLNHFAIGDPNKDADMAETCRAITRLSRRGNSQRSIVVLHHALTGKTGAAKAVGWERSGFGRNSKVLQAWTRGQINLAPVNPDDNDTLVVTCGKCSNGQEFEPFAIRLNTGTMIYECAPDVDLAAWRQEVTGKKAKPDLGPDVVCGIVKALIAEGKDTEKADVVRALQAETGCGRTAAYDAVAQAEQCKDIRRGKDGSYAPHR
jgi:hypothetical protein